MNWLNYYQLLLSVFCFNHTFLGIWKSPSPFSTGSPLCRVGTHRSDIAVIQAKTNPTVIILSSGVFWWRFFFQHFKSMIQGNKHLSRPAKTSNERGADQTRGRGDSSPEERGADSWATLNPFQSWKTHKGVDCFWAGDTVEVESSQDACFWTAHIWIMQLFVSQIV